MTNNDTLIITNYLFFYVLISINFEWVPGAQALIQENQNKKSLR